MYSAQDMSQKSFFSSRLLPKIPKFSQVLATEKALTLIKHLEDHKAQDILAFDVMNKNLCMDVVILLTATSTRHAKGLADRVLEQCTKYNYEYLRMEGYQHGQWVLVDLNDVVINIFQSTIRELYSLETLWKSCPMLSE